MMQHRVNEPRTDGAASFDIFPLFKAAASGAREADQAGRHIEREIHYATLEAIDDAAAEVQPTDIQNALLRLGIAKYLLNRVYDYSYRGIEIDEEISKIDKLISDAARVIVQQSGVDAKETMLDFYLVDSKTA